MAEPFRYMAGEDRQRQYRQELDALVLQKAQLRQQRRAEDRRLEMDTVRTPHVLHALELVLLYSLTLLTIITRNIGNALPERPAQSS